jgi:type I site-specific restriction endonuclease
MNEAETRAEYIDPALKAVGWGVVEGSRVRREYLITPGRIEGQGRPARPEIADYILEYRNHKLGVVEAKARDAAVTEGLGQAKSYAAKLAIRFTYSTNGQGIYGVDLKSVTAPWFRGDPPQRQSRENGTRGWTPDCLSLSRRSGPLHSQGRVARCDGGPR